MAILNPCKSCGEDRLVFVYKDKADNKAVVMCEVCGKTTEYYATVQEAIEAWNNGKTV